MARTRIEDLIPFYITGALSPEEMRAVEAWLRDNPQAESQAKTWELVRSAIKEQPLQSPRQGTFRSITQRIHSLNRRLPDRNPAWLGQLFGSAMAVLILVLLWLSVKPGVVLEWYVRGGAPTSFQIYRAPVGTEDFDLMQEIPAKQSGGLYRYTDLLLLPGTEYSYRIVGIVQNSQLSVSDVKQASTDSVLPGQVGIVLVSALMGYAVIRLFQMLPRGFPNAGVGQIY